MRGFLAPFQEYVMYYKTVKDLIGTKREASGDGWKSRRFLLAEASKAASRCGSSTNLS
jgi:hypothetical protein